MLPTTVLVVPLMINVESKPLRLRTVISSDSGALIVTESLVAFVVKIIPSPATRVNVSVTASAKHGFCPLTAILVNPNLVLLTVIPPVLDDTAIPSPAIKLVTPVLVKFIEPVLDDTLMPVDPARFVTPVLVYVTVLFSALVVADIPLPPANVNVAFALGASRVV